MLLIPCQMETRQADYSQIYYKTPSNSLSRIQNEHSNFLMRLKGFFDRSCILKHSSPATNICFSLADCCQMCYIDNRERKPDTRPTLTTTKINFYKVSRRQCKQWRLFSFSPEYLIAQIHKGNNEYSSLNQVRICNHHRQCPPFFRLEGQPLRKNKRVSRPALVSHGWSISHISMSDNHNILFSLNSLCQIVRYLLVGIIYPLKRFNIFSPYLLWRFSPQN